jgi:predicted CoA-binding protein
MAAHEGLNDSILREILSRHRNVAVVGLSNDLSRPSYIVAEYLKNHGFHIFPVNPFIAEALGEKSYRSLSEMPLEIQKTIEIVDIFRRAEDVLPIAEQAMQMRKMHGSPQVVWMQLGIINEQAAELAWKAGLKVVMNRCIRTEHQRLFGSNIGQK